MYNINLEKFVNDIFADIIQKYHYIIEPVDEDEILLIKNNFAITIGISLDGANITYITIDLNGNYIEYWFANYISSKFDELDRSIVNMPSNNAERIIAEIKIISSGLMRHWNNVLRGDQNWISDFLYNGGHPLKVSEKEKMLLKKYFK